MSILDAGAGAASGLETLLARQLAEDKFDEQKRATKATEDYRGKALGESSALRKQAQEGLDENRRNTQQQQTDNRAARTVALRPIGAPVTEEEYKRETTAGVPQGVYKVTEATPEHVNPQGETPETVEAATRDIKFNGTQAQTDAERRIKDATDRADKSDRDRDDARRIAQDREDRLRSWGPPTVPINDPNSPTGIRVVGRDKIPAEGAAGPGTGAQRQSVSDSQIGEDTLGRLTQNFDKRYVGPIEGRARPILQKMPFVPADKGLADFQADTATLRNAIIRAITGAQMSQPEAERIMAQIPSLEDKEDIWQSKAASTMNNLRSTLLHKGGGGAGASGAGAKPSGNIKSVTEVGK